MRDISSKGRIVLELSFMNTRSDKRIGIAPLWAYTVLYGYMILTFQNLSISLLWPEPSSMRHDECQPLFDRMYGCKNVVVGPGTNPVVGGGGGGGF
jgi:hypothetical protein